MAGLAHIPYLERRPAGLFFRRRIPARLTEIPEPIHGSFLCLSLRTDVLRDARAIVRGLTALTDLAFALMTERRDMRHLAAENIRLLEALARFQVDAHEAARAQAGPRTMEAAEHAAACERATQEALRRAIACGERDIAHEPLRTVAAHLGVALPEEDTEAGRALAFEALRVLLDVSRARERAEIGRFEEPTPIFRSAMARRSAGVSATIGAPSLQAAPMAPIARPIPAAAMMPLSGDASAETGCTDCAPNSSGVRDAVNLDSAAVTITGAAAGTTTCRSAEPDRDVAEPGEELDDETRLRIKMRPPRLENIDVRKLSPESQRALGKARGIGLPEAIRLYGELKLLGYGEKFFMQQNRVASQGEKFRKDSYSKVRVAQAFWPEFVGAGPFEEIEINPIRDALEFLPRLPNKHGKGTETFIAKHGYRELVERLDGQVEIDHHKRLEQARREGRTSEADREAAWLDAQVERLSVETIVKHRRTIAAVGRMLVDRQLADRNPFEVCAVTNAERKSLASMEPGRKRTVWDDRFHIFLASTAFQGGTREPGDPLFWLPLIARLMGLREEEACQLGPDDFGSVDGIPYVDIRRVNENNVKADASVRRLPVHPQLIELGLLHLVEMRRRSGHKRLFIHLTCGKTKGKFSENFSKSFTYYRQTNGCYWPGLDYHAFRTTFHGDLWNPDKSDAIRCRLMGHEYKDEGARSYDQGLGFRTLYDRICDVRIDISKIVSPIADSDHARRVAGGGDRFTVIQGSVA